MHIRGGWGVWVMVMPCLVIIYLEPEPHLVLLCADTPRTTAMYQRGN